MCEACCKYEHFQQAGTRASSTHSQGKRARPCASIDLSSRTHSPLQACFPPFLPPHEYQ